MDSITYIINALNYIIFGNQINIILMIVGSFIGILGGALPGITSVAIVAVLIPFSILLPPETAIITLAAAYVGATYGGSISAILFRVPGATENIATVFDGYEFTRRGKPAEALMLARFYSFIGGLIGGIIILFVTPLLANFAVQFGPAELFMLIVMAILFLSSFGGGFKALLCAFLGFFLATIGIDPHSGVLRFTFGVVELASGLHLVPVFLGLFAIPEVLRLAMRPPPPLKSAAKFKLRELMAPSSSFFKQSFPLIFFVAIPLGFIIGVLPGIGATTAAIVSYTMVKSLSKNPERYGTGVPEGVAVPESANNAAAMGTLVPTLALGIPGGGVTALMLGVFIIHGIRPGPLIFHHNPLLSYSILVGALLINIIMWFEAPIIIYLFVKLLETLRKSIPILVSTVILLCVLGTYIIRNQIIDIWTLLVFSFLGFVLEEYKFPLAPLAIGFVLGGELSEVPFRRALDMSGGDPSIFLSSPISISILIITILAVLIPRITRKYLGGKTKQLNSK